MHKCTKLFKIWYFLAIGLGLGKILWIPTGTVASLFAIPIWWMLVYFFSYQTYFIFLIIGIVIGIYCCHCADQIIGIHDHKSVVWDEFVGMWITLTVVPIYSVFWIIFAFFLFRTLDIIKPYPVSWCDQNVSGGFGVMLDDVCSGIISVCIILFWMNIFN